jgi:uncharacterized protein (TIGR00266 family)
MQVEILYRPAHSLARIWLAPNESIVAESGAMIGMSTNMEMQTSSGGLMSGIKRLFGGESFFRNTFTARQGNGELLLAHSLCGDMVVLPLQQNSLFLQNSAFIAASPEIAIETRAGVRSFFSGAGMFMLEARGSGALLLGAFGGLEEIYCNGSIVIDTGHLVAWEPQLNYTIGKSGSGWISSWISGEGLVCNFSGNGRIWIQSRNPSAYGEAVGRLLPPRES